MVFPFLVLFSSLSLASVAAYFSIIGLTTIFPGSFWPIVIMGSVLEVGKLVTAVWLHRNWKNSTIMMKSYLASAVVILSIITSMGIFGFLSKSHIEQESGSYEVLAQISMIDNQLDSIQIKRSSLESQKQTIEALKDEDYNSIVRMNSRLEILDSTISEIRQKGGFSVSKKISEAQESQSNERGQISEEKLKIQTRMESYRNKIETVIFPELESLEANSLKINLEKSKLESDIKKLEAEIGPVKYIAEIVSDFGGPTVNTASAVRIVILILIFVFDPLAILLVVAASKSFNSTNSGEHKDLVEFRNKLIVELEMHMANGNSAESFIDKYKI